MATLEARMEKAHARREERLKVAQDRKHEHEDLVHPHVSIKKSVSTVKPVSKVMANTTDRKVEIKSKKVMKPSVSSTPSSIIKPSTTTAVGFHVGERSKIAPKVYRQPSYWDAQGGGFQAKKGREIKVTKAIGFSVGKKERAVLRPDGMKFREGLADPMFAGVIEDDVIQTILNDEGNTFQLSETEIHELEKLIELQFLIESDPEISNIQGSEDVVNVIGRLAAVGGNIIDLQAEDQAAVLTLMAFNNVVPGNTNELDDKIMEAGVLDVNNFVQYVDHTGTSVFIRKGSYVKCQLFEKKIEDEMKNFEKFNKTYFNTLIAFCVIYIILKTILLVYGSLFSGLSEGYEYAMMKIENINERNNNISLF